MIKPNFGPLTSKAPYYLIIYKRAFCAGMTQAVTACEFGLVLLSQLSFSPHLFPVVVMRSNVLSSSPQLSSSLLSLSIKSPASRIATATLCPFASYTGSIGHF